MKYSIIVPAYNEEKIIDTTIDSLYRFLQENKLDFELIIANDGSKDQTVDKVRGKLKQYKNLKIVSNPQNKGRGAVLTRALQAAKGEICVYVDADLSIDLSLFPQLLFAIEQGADVAIGSKHLKDSEVEYPKLRRLASKGYSFLTRFLLQSKVKDYQCGFKAFKKDVVHTVLPYVKEEGWSWDTEINVKSEWAGYRVTELPAKVVNVYGRESKVHLFRDIKRMGLNLFKLWREKGKYKELLRRNV